MSRYGVFSGQYFPAFELNTEIYGIKLDTFHAVYVLTCQRALRAYVFMCQRVLRPYALTYRRASFDATIFSFAGIDSDVVHTVGKV